MTVHILQVTLWGTEVLHTIILKLIATAADGVYTYVQQAIHDDTYHKLRSKTRCNVYAPSNAHDQYCHMS